MTNHEESVSRVTATEPSWELLTSLCGAGSCPTVYRTGRGTLLVQGAAVSSDAAGISVPEGEALVEISEELLTQASALLRNSTGDSPQV